MFTTYGLTICSEFPLPELRPAADCSDCDVAVRSAAIPCDGLGGGRQIGPLMWTSPNTLWLQIPDIARFVVRGGNEILVDPHPGIDAPSLRLFLLGPALGAVLMQRGFLVLHGSALVRNGAAIVAVGRSGSGKSTLAETLRRRGWRVLADEIVAIDAAGAAHPGFPRIKLWGDVLDHLGIDPGDHMPVRPNVAKYDVGLSSGIAVQPAPVRCVYALETSQHDGVSIAPVVGFDRFGLLRDHAYRVRMLDGLGLQATHLDLGMKLAARARFSTVYRHADAFLVDQLADAIAADALRDMPRA